jgi:hypothetical protein
MAALMVVGCATPYATPELDPVDLPFVGIGHALAARGSADVLLVHGMCTHDASDLQEAVASLGLALHMKPDDAKDVTLSAVWPDAAGAQLYSVNLTGATHTVRTFALLWSPIATAYKKARLCYDVSEPTDSCADADAAYRRPRARLNARVKNVLLDDCLADATFYVGTEGRRSLTSAAYRAVATALAGGRDSAGNEAETLAIAATSTTPFFLISHSLGSKIVADALQDKRDVVSLDAALGRTHQVFMQANQLAMLSIGETPIGASARIPQSDAIGQLMNRIMKAREQNAFMRDQPPLKLVAFSDPNDLLSWGLRGAAAEVGGVPVVDVWVSNAPTVLGAVENPLKAHVGYARNPAVTRLMACGWRTGTAASMCR